jgi:hypothetical protein
MYCKKKLSAEQGCDEAILQEMKIFFCGLLKKED